MILNLPGPRNSTNYNPGITKTFRLASRKLFRKYGTNLQNVNKAMRRIYITRPKHKFLQVDQAGAEALIVAFLCLPGKYRQLFLHGIKPHVFVALHIFADVWRKYLPDVVDKALVTEISELKNLEGWDKLDKLIKSSDDWPNKDFPDELRYYYIGKKLCHSSNYGQGPGRLALTILEETEGRVVLSSAQAKIYLEHYHSLFPEIRAWQLRVEHQVLEDGILYNLFGYPSIVTKKPTEHEMKEWIAFVPQSTVATITNIALTRFQNEYIEDQNKDDWHLAATTHDSIMAEIPDDDIDEAGFILLDLMRPTLTAPDGSRFRMGAELQVGSNWAPYKRGENEEGMREYQPKLLPHLN